MRTMSRWLVLAVLAGGCAAHEDVIEGPHGMEDVPSALRGQGRNTARDRAYAAWAQYDDNTTLLLERPRGKRWISVGDAVLFAKRTWNLNILDETGEPAVAALRFATSFGPVEREMARPLFIQALCMAVEALPGCYVVQDDETWVGSTHRAYRGNVHIRMARPLQPDYPHPSDPDKSAERWIEADLEREDAALGDIAPWTTWYELHDMDFQAEVSRLLAEYHAGYLASPEALRAEYAKLRAANRHTRTRWLSTHGPVGLDPREAPDAFPESGGYDAFKDRRMRKAAERGSPAP